MDYFRKLQQLLQVEKEEDRKSFELLTEKLPITERRENGMTWFPIAIKDTELGQGDYLVVEIERTSHLDLTHQFRSGMSAALFSQYDPKTDRVNGTINYVSGNRIKISLRTDEVPDWSRNGKLGLDALFDTNSYEEMERALKLASTLIDKKEEGRLIQILTGKQEPGFHLQAPHFLPHSLNNSQQEAVNKILAANELAIIHGPPGTGKTTTLVQAIKALNQRDHQQLLVVAPSNTAVDLLSEKLADEGLNVLRVGNPARVSEKQLNLTLDYKMTAHSSMKEIRKLKKRAAEFRDLAQKYKRNFGKEEREQRKALFTEARNIIKDVERTEQYIVNDLISKADVITATLVGANHYTVRHLKFDTVVIDEAGQALEPACWIPILKANKVVMAGDHCQLPPTIKSAEAAREGLGKTLMEKGVARHPSAVVLLEEQYRMHQHIMQFSSQKFYGGNVKAHSSVEQHVLFDSDIPLNFVDTAGCGFEEKWEGTSISNPEEASFLVKHLTHFLQQVHSLSLSHPTIAVISPYRHQVEILKQYVQEAPELSNASLFITVNTIDSFQGQERDVVYISMTRSNTDNNIGFLSDIRRMNVAMTRARKKLVVIGDSATLSQLSFYENFISYAQSIESYRSAWEFM